MGSPSLATPASRKAAVIDSVPLARRGIASVATELSFDACEFSAIESLPQGCNFAILIVSLRSESDWDAMTAADICATVCTIALVPTLTPAAVMRALASAVRSIVGLSAEPAFLADSIHAAQRGKVVLDIDIVRQLVDAEQAPSFSQQQLQWIRALASGTTVAQLASDSSYSEREMYRHLARIYRGLGASNRVEAVLHAYKAGLLDRNDPWQSPDGQSWSSRRE